MPKRKKVELTEAVKIQLAELMLRGATYERIAVELNWGLHQLFTYRKNNPEFDKLLEEARGWSAQKLEDDLLTMAIEEDLTYGHKVKADILSRIMIARDPGRYNPKVEISVSQNVDLDRALLEANKRSRDVTNSIPAVLTLAKQIAKPNLVE